MMTPDPSGAPRRGAWTCFAGPALLAATLALISVPALAQQQACPAPTRAEAEAIGRAYFEAFNKGDAAALDALLSPDYRHRGAVVERQDRALHLDRLNAVRAGFPDGVFTIEWLLVDGDEVAIRHAFRGTHKGAFAGVPASGRPVAVGAFHVHRIACGRIAETWNAGDGIGLLRQIGAIPGPATTPATEEMRAPARTARESCPTVTPESNARTARRWYEDVLNAGRFDVFDEIVADDVVAHAAMFVDFKGREQTGASMRAIRTGFPDIRYTIDGVIEDGDFVLIRWTGRGTQSGPFLGVQPSGAKVDWSGMNAFRLACGKIVEVWSEANGLAIMRQIGAIK